jgi:ADP-ribose pyrophosphatase
MSQPEGMQRGRAHGPWRILHSREAYSDPWVKVQRDECLRPDGREGSYTVVHIKPGVCVVAVDNVGNLHLTEEFHYGVGRVTLEAVSGGREPGEPPLVAAQRELREELGIEASSWTDLGSIDPFTANLVSPTQLFLAQQLRWCTASPEGTELIRPMVMPLAEAIERVMTGQISHAPSAVLILKIARLLS